MASDMKILFVFNFETGDYSCPWWQEIAVVYGSNEDAKTLSNCIYSLRYGRVPLLGLAV